MRNTSHWAKYLSLFLALYILVSLIALGATAFGHLSYLSAQTDEPTFQEFLFGYSVQETAAQSLVALVGILAVIAGLRWFYLSSWNIHQTDVDGLKIKPGWSVRWFLIPVFSIWKPLRAAFEIFAVSRYGSDWQNQGLPLVYKVWWGSWLASGFLGLASALSLATFVDWGFGQAYFGLSYAYQVMDILSAVLFMLFVRQITNLQKPWFN